MSDEYQDIDEHTRALSLKFRGSCLSGNFNEIKAVSKILAQKDMKFLHNELDECLIFACKNGQLELVSFLLASKELDHHAFIHANSDSAIEEACENGHLNVVKYLLTSKQLKEHAELNSRAFTSACATDQVNVVQYLLSNPKFENVINMDVIFSGLIQTCRYGSTRCLKNIWENTGIKDSKQLGKNLSEVFGLAHLRDHMEVVHYIIFDLDIAKDERVNGYLSAHHNDQVNKWFDLRELNKDLSQNLDTGEKNNRKAKI